MCSLVGVQVLVAQPESCPTRRFSVSEVAPRRGYFGPHSCKTLQLSVLLFDVAQFSPILCLSTSDTVTDCSTLSLSLRCLFKYPRGTTLFVHLVLPVFSGSLMGFRFLSDDGLIPSQFRIFISCRPKKDLELTLN